MGAIRSGGAVYVCLQESGRQVEFCELAGGKNQPRQGSKAWVKGVVGRQ